MLNSRFSQRSIGVIAVLSAFICCCYYNTVRSLSNRGSRVELNRTIRHKPTAISASLNNLLDQHYNVQFNVAISAQKLVAKHNKSASLCVKPALQG